MAIKEKQDNFLSDIGLEAEFSENNSSWTINIDNLERIDITDLDENTEVSGVPEFVIYDNSNKKNRDGSPRKFDNIVLRLIDVDEIDEYGEQNGEYLQAYLPCPRPDSQGNISNVFKDGFYHGTFVLIYSYLKLQGEEYVLDKKGNIINTIKRINIVKLLDKLNNSTNMEIKIKNGADGDTRNKCYMITKIE